MLQKYFGEAGGGYSACGGGSRASYAYHNYPSEGVASEDIRVQRGGVDPMRGPWQEDHPVLGMLLLREHAVDLIEEFGLPWARSVYLCLCPKDSDPCAGCERPPKQTVPC